MFPKTLFLELAHHFGGSGTRLLTIMKSLPKDKVGLISLAGSVTAEMAQALGYKTYTVGNHKYDPFIFSRIRKIAKQGKYELIDSQNINSKIWGFIVAYWSDIAFVSTVNSQYQEEYGGNIKGWIYHSIDMITNSKLDFCIAVSAEVHDALIKSGIPKDKIELISNSISINPEEIFFNKDQLINEFNIPSDSIVGVAVGRLVWVKGFDVLVDAMKIVKLIIPNFICLIIGEGPLLSELSDQISKAKLKNNIILAGYHPLSEVHAILKSSDIFIMPSRSEGTPMALLEAAALARPIIASRVGGIPDIVADKVHALLIEPGSPHELAQAIINLSENPDISNKLGMQAQKRIENYYNPAVQAGKLKKAYLQALKNNKR